MTNQVAFSKLKRKVIFVALLVFAVLLNGQEEAEIDKWMELELEDLAEVRIVSVSVGKKNITIREAPGIISLITAEEIENSGARDLIDVLRLVPGFAFGIDVESTLGLGIRGNWGHEGKIMLLWDGQEMNERLYGTLQFGTHFPVRQIDRIEIIRGPGSSLYGEFAELAVINVVTKANPGRDTWEISGQYGQMSKTYARRELNLNLNKKLGDLDFSLGLFLSGGNRSQSDYTDIYGNSYDMSENSATSTVGLNLGLTFKQFSCRFVMDQYHFDMRDDFDEIYELPIKYLFNSYHLEAKGEFHLGKTMKLVPKINYSTQYPWNSIDENARLQDNYYKVRVERFKFALNLSGDLTNDIFLNCGVVQAFDRGTVLGDTQPDYYFPGEKKEIDYANTSVFAQTFIKTPLVIFTGGLRFDHHQQYGSSVVPWIGVNKVFKKLYFKFLFGRTFRAPTISNITLNPEIKPEKSIEVDFEIGYPLSKSMIVSLNFFSAGVKNPIIYSIDPETDEELYMNFGKTGSFGFELEYLLKGKWGYMNTNYSFYRARKDNLELYRVEDHPGLALGFPAHKFTVNANILAGKQWSINPSLVYYSQRFGYNTADEEGNPLLEPFAPVFMANLFLRYKNVFRGVDVGLGIYDIFGENYRFIQPYNGSHAVFPGPAREIMLRIDYRSK